MKCRGKPDATWSIPRSIVFPATFHVKSRKVDYLWDSEYTAVHTYSTCTRYCHILSLSSYLEDRLRQNQFKILYILMKAESLIKSGNLLLWEKNLRTAQRDALSSCTRTITSRDDTFYTFKHLNIYIFASLLKFVLRI